MDWKAILYWEDKSNPFENKLKNKLVVKCKVERPKIDSSQLLSLIDTCLFKQPKTNTDI